MNATGCLLTQDTQVPESLVWQAMSGSSEPKIITWYGDGFVVIADTESAANADGKPNDPITAIVQPQRTTFYTSEKPVEVRRPNQPTADQETDWRRRIRTANDIREILQQAINKLPREQRRRHMDTGIDEAVGSLLAHDDDRKGRSMIAERRIWE